MSPKRPQLEGFDRSTPRAGQTCEWSDERSKSRDCLDTPGITATVGRDSFGLDRIMVRLQTRRTACFTRVIHTDRYHDQVRGVCHP
jgi:hypothetical protein